MTEYSTFFARFNVIIILLLLLLHYRQVGLRQPPYSARRGGERSRGDRRGDGWDEEALCDERDRASLRAPQGAQLAAVAPRLAARTIRTCDSTAQVAERRGELFHSFFILLYD